jgi:hypothetical protein
MKLKVSAWMQDKTLSKVIFIDKYHQAFRNIAMDSEKILQKLSKDAEIPGSTTKPPPNAILPPMVKLPKPKKM